jgi:hypothetical protein
MPKRQVKEKKPRSIRAESEAKKECKELNIVIEKEAPKTKPTTIL